MSNSDDHPLMRWVNYSVDHLPQIADIELATVKVHLLIEGALRYLLAARLGVPENTFAETRIEFAALAEFALAGQESHLVGAVRAINSARNHVSHLIDTTPIQDKLATFATQAGYLSKEVVRWPSETYEQLSTLRGAVDAVVSRIFLIAIAAEDERAKLSGA